MSSPSATGVTGLPDLGNYEGIRAYYVPDSPFAALVGDSRFVLLAGCLVVVDVERGFIVTVYDRYLDEIGFADWWMI